MYVDIWDIEIITHAAERNRDYNRLGYPQPDVVV